MAVFRVRLDYYNSLNVLMALFLNHLSTGLQLVLNYKSQTHLECEELALSVSRKFKSHHANI